MISMKEMIIDQQNLIDLLLTLHRKFKEDPTTGNPLSLTGNPLSLTGCHLENVTIRNFDFDGVSCHGAYFAAVDFIDIKNPPWETAQGAYYHESCTGIKP